MADHLLCPDCGHHHAGPHLANICIGCPCPRTEFGEDPRFNDPANDGALDARMEADTDG